MPKEPAIDAHSRKEVHSYAIHGGKDYGVSARNGAEVRGDGCSAAGRSEDFRPWASGDAGEASGWVNGYGSSGRVGLGKAKAMGDGGIRRRGRGRGGDGPPFSMPGAGEEPEGGGTRAVGTSSVRENWAEFETIARHVKEMRR